LRLRTCVRSAAHDSALLASEHHPPGASQICRVERTSRWPHIGLHARMLAQRSAYRRKRGQDGLVVRSVGIVSASRGGEA
jgi:hypothetical protein